MNSEQQKKLKKISGLIRDEYFQPTTERGTNRFLDYINVATNYHI